VSKRRIWLKLHLGVDEKTGEIVEIVVRASNVADSGVLPDLLEQIEEDIEQISADVVYDTKKSYKTIEAQGANLSFHLGKML
jgi:hypothetical protein